LGDSVGAMARGGFFAVDSLSSVHILVVDDDGSFRDVLVALLRYCGALVTAVGTPEEALMAMDQVKPDVVVFTVGGDRISATSLPRRVRARKPEDGGNVPILAILREGGAATLSESVNAQVVEPLNPWELCRMISTLLATG
jgi:CheY-like chemotaxis protein